MSKKRHLGPTERWVQLHYWMLNSAAWRSLNGNAVKLYIELKKRYNGSNNGRIPFSVREAANVLHGSLQTGMRTLQVLEDRGFIVCTRKGAFSLKASPNASEWRLTEYPNDNPPEHATRNFMRWQPPEPDLPAPPRSRSRLSTRKLTLPPEEPIGSHGGSAIAKKVSHGCRGGSANGQNRPRALPPEQHLYLPGTDSAAGGEQSAPPPGAVASERRQNEKPDEKDGETVRAQPAKGVSRGNGGTTWDTADRESQRLANRKQTPSKIQRLLNDPPTIVERPLASVRDPSRGLDEASPELPLSYPACSPSRDEVLAAMERRADERERDRQRSPPSIVVHK